MTTKKMFVVVLLALIMVMSTSAVAAVYAQGNQTSTTISIPSYPIDTLTLSVATIVAILGTITAAVLGWQESGEPFNSGKFVASLLHAIVAGAVIIVGFGFNSSINFLDFLVIYLTGAGVDVLLNRVTGAIAQKGATTASSTTATSPPPPPASSASSQTGTPGTTTSAPSPPAASPT